MNSSRTIQQLNQVLAHVIAGMPDLHLGPVRIEVNFHLHLSSRARHRISPHTHPWVDVSMMRSGKIEYQADNRAIVPTRNQVTIFPETTEHAWIAHSTPLVLESYMLGLFAQNRQGEKILDGVRQKTIDAGYCFTLSAALRKYRSEIWSTMTERPQSPLQTPRLRQLMQMFVVQLFADLFADAFTDVDARLAERVGQPPASAKLVIRMEEYLRTHLAEKITMSDLERQFSYSHRHLVRLFKEKTGHSIQQYLLTKRLLAACDLLINSNARTKEAAHAVGFTDVSYFCRIFREYTRFTPQQYREHHCK